MPIWNRSAENMTRNDYFSQDDCAASVEDRRIAGTPCSRLLTPTFRRSAAVSSPNNSCGSLAILSFELSGPYAVPIAVVGSASLLRANAVCGDLRSSRTARAVTTNTNVLELPETNTQWFM
jgi:O-acetylhomoserine/O-acetylserine sulfhydrylase-like pyridoxal-dependent enzyme